MKEHQQLGTAQQSFYAARQAHNILAREQNARASTKPRANQLAHQPLTRDYAQRSTVKPLRSGSYKPALRITHHCS